MTTREVAPGVFVSLQRPEGGGPGLALRRVRFAKQVFSAEAAEAWWAANRHEVMSRYGVSEGGGGGSGGGVEQGAASSAQQQPGDPGASGGGWQAAGGSGAAASSTGGGGGDDGLEAQAPPRVRVARRVSAGNVPPGASPPATPTPTFSSPACSTHDVDPFRPPTTFAAAAAPRPGGAGAGGQWGAAPAAEEETWRGVPAWELPQAIGRSGSGAQSAGGSPAARPLRTASVGSRAAPSGPGSSGSGAGSNKQQQQQSTKGIGIFRMLARSLSGAGSPDSPRGASHSGYV